MNRRSDTPKPPIVVWCRHGIDDRHAGDFVQRYRYNVGARWWGASDHSAEGSTSVNNVGDVGDSGNQPPMFDEGGDPATVWREHFNARCKRCPRLVAMSAERAQIALTWLADAGLTDIPLAALQRAYNEASLPRRV